MRTVKPSTAAKLSALQRIAQCAASVAAAKSELAKLLAVVPAPPGAPVTRAAIASAAESYENALASLALGETDAEAVEAARAKLAQAEAEDLSARAAVATDQARRAGVTRRVKSAEDAVAGAEALLLKALVQWVGAAFKTAELDYLDAARALASSMARAEALRAWAASMGHPLTGTQRLTPEAIFLPALSPAGSVVARNRELGLPDDHAASGADGPDMRRSVLPPVDGAAAVKAIELEVMELTRPQALSTTAQTTFPTTAEELR